MKRLPPIDIDVALYRIHVVLFIGWDLDAMIAHGRKHGISEGCFTPDWKSWMSAAIETAAGLCANFGESTKNSDILIWLRDNPTKASEYGPLWHELLHAVDKIALHADPSARFFAESGMSEPRAFLYEYLAVKFTQVLWNRKPEKKSKKKN